MLLFCTRLPAIIQVKTDFVTCSSLPHLHPFVLTCTEQWAAITPSTGLSENGSNVRSGRRMKSGFSRYLYVKMVIVSLQNYSTKQSIAIGERIHQISLHTHTHTHTNTHTHIHTQTHTRALARAYATCPALMYLKPHNVHRDNSIAMLIQAVQAYNHL